jgi:superfamily II DNA or RNA helicase
VESPNWQIEGLYPFQSQAVNAWAEAGHIGLLEMATGTGKTRTACACVSAITELGTAFIIVVVPSVHIGKQWIEELRPHGPIEVNGSNPSWERTFRRELRQISFGHVSNMVAVAVMNTAATRRFIELAQQAANQVKNTLFVGDEVHWLGASEFQRALVPFANFRLGLSATPTRYFDDEGTGVLKAYFGERPVYEMPLRKALETKKPNGEPLLTPYEYEPRFVSLTDEEIERYRKFAKTMAVYSNPKNFDPQRVKNARVGASRIVKKAEAKAAALGDLLDELGENLHFALIYCEDSDQMNTAREELHSRGLFFGEITEAESSSERQKVLSNFSKGYIDVILAMRCLDEGVDIPEARIGIILASSGNPREFIQRRGRLMRTSPGKHSAVIYDFAVLATPEILEGTGLDSIKDKELARIAEFSEDATNAEAVVASVAGLWVL